MRSSLAKIIVSCLFSIKPLSKPQLFIVRDSWQWPSDHVDGLVQERRNSSALAMELRLSSTNPSMWLCLTKGLAMFSAYWNYWHLSFIYKIIIRYVMLYNIILLSCRFYKHHTHFGVNTLSSKKVNYFAPSLISHKWYMSSMSCNSYDTQLFPILHVGHASLNQFNHT